MPSDDSEDVPSGIDLRDPAVARRWTLEADAKQPRREHAREAIAETLVAARARRVLELGSGPGLLAQKILSSCAIDSYTLFDFSPPMLDLSRERIGEHPAASFVLGDFKQEGWTESLAAPFDAVVTMQAVHEIRHKRHVPGLYKQIFEILRPGGLLLVCDHAPMDDSARMTALHSTEAEQHAAFASAGFNDVRTVLFVNRLYLCRGQR